MNRLLQVRMLIVLLALAIVPAATLPYAERVRAAWTRFWEPRPSEVAPVEEIDSDDARRRAFFAALRNSDARRIDPTVNGSTRIIVLDDETEWIDVQEYRKDPSPATAALRIPLKLRSNTEATRAVEIDIPRFVENP